MKETVEILLSAEEIDKRVGELAGQILKDYDGKLITLVGTLKGAFIFTADLARKLGGNVEIDFLRASSYGMESTTSGSVKIDIDISLEMEGRHILLVEDIVDTGYTLKYLKDHILERNPASLKVCTLLDKPDRREAKGITFDYLGFEIPDHFVVGYGLDYAQRYRSLPYVGILHFEEE
jgi:hypoxanthine phosphoribosyltransferase